MAADRPRPRAGGALPVLPPFFALVELAIFAAVVAAEFLWEPFPNLTKLNPHPYWLPVLLISLQYGTLSGLLAAAIAIIGTVFIGLPEQDIGEAYFNYLVRAWAQPVLWLVVALLLGAFRMRQIEQRDDLLHQVEDLQQQGRLLDEHADALQGRCDRLERELVTKERPEPQRLLDALARCAGGVGGEAEVDAALTLAFPDAVASLYVRETRTGGGFRLVQAHRWPPNATWPRQLSGHDPLASSLVGGQRALSILTAGDDTVLHGHGLFAVPIADETGLVGMLKIERLPPAAIDTDTVGRLAYVAAHLARIVATLNAERPTGAETPIGTTTAGGARVLTIPRLIRRSVATALPHGALRRR